MFNLITDVLKAAADTVAPPPTQKDDFVYNWTLICRFYKRDDNFKQYTHILESNVPFYLRQMLQILVKESNEQKDSTQECLQYILDNGIIDTIISLYNVNILDGTQEFILQWFHTFLICVKYPILKYPGVYFPLQNLFTSFIKTDNSAHVVHEINLIQKYTAQVLNYEDNLVLLKNKDFVLINVVLKYISSNNTIVRARTCETVLILCCNCNVAPLIAESVSECVCQQLVVAYENLSTNKSDLTELLKMSIKWGFSEVSDDCFKTDEEDYSATNKVKTTTTLLYWLDYFHTLVSECHSLAKMLVGFWKKIFLTTIHDSFVKCPLKAVKVTTKLLSETWIPDIYDVLSEWFIENADTITAMLNTNEDINIEILQLLCVLFEQPLTTVFAKLILQYIPKLETEKLEQLQNCETLAPLNLNKTALNFTLLLPYHVLQKPNETYTSYMEHMRSLYLSRVESDKKNRNLADHDHIDSSEECGPVLSPVMRLVEKMHENSIDTNKALASLIITMCLSEYPCLHEYLYNTSRPFGLYSSLQKTTKLIALQIMRKNNAPCALLNERLWIMEKLCKKIAAIAFVKYNVSCKS